MTLIQLSVNADLVKNTLPNKSIKSLQFQIVLDPLFPINAPTIKALTHVKTIVEEIVVLVPYIGRWQGSSARNHGKGMDAALHTRGFNHQNTSIRGMLNFLYNVE